MMLMVTARPCHPAMIPLVQWNPTLSVLVVSLSLLYFIGFCSDTANHALPYLISEGISKLTEDSCLCLEFSVIKINTYIKIES